jgi:hypothetical protein
LITGNPGGWKLEPGNWKSQTQAAALAKLKTTESWKTTRAFGFLQASSLWRLASSIGWQSLLSSNELHKQRLVCSFSRRLEKAL